jgi:hypothetical protein
MAGAYQRGTQLPGHNVLPDACLNAAGGTQGPVSVEEEAAAGAASGAAPSAPRWYPPRKPRVRCVGCGFACSTCPRCRCFPQCSCVTHTHPSSCHVTRCCCCCCCLTPTGAWQVIRPPTPPPRPAQLHLTPGCLGVYEYPPARAGLPEAPWFCTLADRLLVRARAARVALRPRTPSKYSEPVAS